MTMRNYHTPPQPGSNRVRCPVCHEAVYSRAGIHPQCAVRQSDPPRPKNAPPVPDVAVEAEPAAEAEAEPVLVPILAEVAPAPAAKRRRG